MSDVVIKAEHLSKYYKLGVINNGTFFRDMQTWLALKRGKQDPHSRIGENKYDPTKEGFWALKDLNFEIHQGDRVGIIGKNGAGKSTLLKILSRITAPTEGNVKIKGRVASLLEVGTGFHGELTGRENIFLNGAILGMKKREVQRKLDEIIAFSEIEQHIDTPVKRYSSGMYVRLAFAVAAHLDSEILIADEVLAVGDASFQKKALGKMNDLSTGEGRTILFVSHNMLAVKNLCSKGIVLNKGKITLEGDLHKCIDEYNGIIKNSENGPLILRINNNSNSNKECEISEFFIGNKNGAIDDYDIKDTKDKYLYIKSFMKQLDPKFMILITISNKDNDYIWTSDIFESGSIKVEDIKQGAMNYKIKLPLEYLASGEYSLNVSAVIHYKHWIIEPNIYTLDFLLNKAQDNHPIYACDNHPLTGSNKPSLLECSMPVEII